MRHLWTSMGVVALAVGAIGVVLPLLPTTPFVILAAFFFARGSSRLARWLDTHQVFGPIIHDWRLRGAIATRYKVIAIVMMAAALGVSAAMNLSALVLVIQTGCMLAAAAFILSRPSQ